MAGGCWEVDVPKKANSFCAHCTNPISTSELRFQWCPAAGGPKPYLHVLCAVKAGSQKYTRVSKASVRKSSGLTGAQRETLAALLAAPGEAAAAALLKAAGGAQAQPAAASTKRSTPAPADEPPAKREKPSAKLPASGVATRAPAKAKAKVRAVKASKIVTRPKAKAKTKAAPKAKAKAKAKGKAKAKARVKLPVETKAGPRATSAAKPSAGPGPKGKAALSPKDLAKFEEQRRLFGSWTGDKLKALLQANDQSRSGNKAVLVAKCADGAAFGKLPRCPKCFGGKIKFRMPGADGSMLSLFGLLGGAYGQDKADDQSAEKFKDRKRYYCTGFFDDDEKQECDWQADAVKREAWAAC